MRLAVKQYNLAAIESHKYFVQMVKAIAMAALKV